MYCLFIICLYFVCKPTCTLTNKFYVLENLSSKQTVSYGNIFILRRSVTRYISKRLVNFHVGGRLNGLFLALYGYFLSISSRKNFTVVYLPVFPLEYVESPATLSGLFTDFFQITRNFSVAK